MARKHSSLSENVAQRYRQRMLQYRPQSARNLRHCQAQTIQLFESSSHASKQFGIRWKHFIQLTLRSNIVDKKNTILYARNTRA